MLSEASWPRSSKNSKARKREIGTKMQMIFPFCQSKLIFHQPFLPYFQSITERGFVVTAFQVALNESSCSKNLIFVGQIAPTIDKKSSPTAKF